MCGLGGRMAASHKCIALLQIPESIILALASLPVLKRKWLGQLRMGEHNSRINPGMTGRILKSLEPDDNNDSLELKDWEKFLLSS